MFSIDFFIEIFDSLQISYKHSCKYSHEDTAPGNQKPVDTEGKPERPDEGSTDMAKINELLVDHEFAFPGNLGPKVRGESSGSGADVEGGSSIPKSGI